MIKTNDNKLGNMKCDFNGDGFDDYIQRVFGVGIYVYYGPLEVNFPYNANYTYINGSNGFIYLNTLIPTKDLACGDINNDGKDDIVIWVNISPGQSHIIYGSDQVYSPATFSSLDGVNGFKIFAIINQTYNVAFGYNKGIGDFNGDGIKDIIVATSIGSLQSQGTHVAYVIFGIDGGKFPVTSSFVFDQSTLNGSNGIIIYNIVTFNLMSADMNNDGIADIIINRGQIALVIIYGRSQPFSSPVYTPLLDGNDGTVFNIVDGSITTNLNPYGFGDFNGDNINDFAVPIRVNANNNNVLLVVFGRKEYPASIQIGPNSFNGTNGFAIIENIVPSIYSWGTTPKIADVNGDGIADIMVTSQTRFRILFGNIFKYNSGIVNFDNEISIGQCVGFQMPTSAIGENSFGDYNGDGLNDIVLVGDKIVYGIKYIGSIKTKNSNFLPNDPTTNLIYKIFENNLELTQGICGIIKITLTIDNPIQGDYLFVDSIIDSSVYSITQNVDSTSLVAQFIKRNDSYSIVDDVLNFISVSLVNSHSNRTISLEYGNNNVESIVINGYPVQDCTWCLGEGGDCNSITGCTLNCTTDCYNGGSCNTTIGECSCLTGSEGADCSIILCSNTCKNGGSCNTTIGECSCLNGYEGIDCNGISCTLTCENGGSCNTTIGECSCITGFEGISCNEIICTSTCKNGGTCNKTIGSCECLSNFSGKDCSQIDGDSSDGSDDNKTNVGVIVGPVLGGCAVVVAATSGFVIFKRKKNNSKETPSPPPVIELQEQPSVAQMFIGGRIENMDKF